MSGILRILSIGLAFALALLIAWAAPSGEAGAAIAFLTGTPWGLVTSADLYIGFLLSGTLIALYERNLFGFLVAAAILVLGNVVTALWFAWRWPELIKLFREARGAG